MYTIRAGIHPALAIWRFYTCDADLRYGLMKKKLHKILLIICAAAFCFSATKVALTLRSYRENEQAYEGMALRYQSAKAEAPAEQSSPGLPEAPIDVDFEALGDMSGDVAGWIYCEGTSINYPIMQGRDNSYYLDRMPDGRYNAAGSIFMDFRCPRDLSGVNTIIYGHRMGNDSMFHSLRDYSSQDYYEQHPCMWILTPDASYRLDLIAGFVVDTKDEIYTVNASFDELSAIASNAAARSEFKAFEPSASADTTRIVTLSTCTYEFNNARYVVVGYLTDAQ